MRNRFKLVKVGYRLRFYSFTVIILLCSTLVRANSSDDLIWNKANVFYVQKQYDSAIVYYNELLKKYPESAALQYNAGNVNFRLNQVGKAILHYEKAAHLSPDNKEIEDNLLLAKGRVLNPLPEVPPIFFVKWWDNLLTVFSSNVWAVITFICFLALLFLIYYARMKKEHFTHAGRWLSTGIVCLLISACITYFSHDKVMHSGKAVVLQAAVDFLNAPERSGKVLGSLPEGTVLEVYMEQGNFINVKLPNGRVGWVIATSIEKV